MLDKHIFIVYNNEGVNQKYFTRKGLTVKTMAKDLTLGILLDFYGGLLTEKQAMALDFYYNQDLSLAEIADEMHISRQGVMAFLKQGEKHLRAYEDKLGLASRFGEINSEIKKMRGIAEAMEKSAECEELLNLINSVSAKL